MLHGICLWQSELHRVKEPSNDSKFGAHCKKHGASKTKAIKLLFLLLSRFVKEHCNPAFCIYKKQVKPAKYAIQREEIEKFHNLDAKSCSSTLLPYWSKQIWYQLLCYLQVCRSGAPMIITRSGCWSNLVDPASSHMLVLKIKPCMSKYKPCYDETANGSLKQL